MYMIPESGGHSRPPSPLSLDLSRRKFPFITMSRNDEESEWIDQPSTMIGRAPHAEADIPPKVAIIDPSASLDMQTGAVIGKKTAEERRFVARLDAILLVYTCISQVLKYLDQQK